MHHVSAIKEAQWQAREERARQYYERQLEERRRRLEEQRVKEDKRRAAVEEKRRQKLEDDKVRHTRLCTVCIMIFYMHAHLHYKTRVPHNSHRREQTNTFLLLVNH